MGLKFKSQRMTQKAKKALALAAELTGDDVRSFRTDRSAMQIMYDALEAFGYMWVASKLEWARVRQPEQEKYVRFTVTGMLEDKEDVQYMIMQCLAAGGFHVTRHQTEEEGIGQSAVFMMGLEVER